MTYRVRYRDKRRPWASTAIERVQVDCRDARAAARIAAATARGRLKARGITPQIVGIAAD